MFSYRQLIFVLLILKTGYSHCTASNPTNKHARRTFIKFQDSLITERQEDMVFLKYKQNKTQILIYHVVRPLETSTACDHHLNEHLHRERKSGNKVPVSVRC